MRKLGESGWVGLALHGWVGGQSEQRETKEDDAQKGQCFVGCGAIALRLHLHEDKWLVDDQAPRVLAIS